MSDRNNPKHWFDQIDEVHKAKNTEEFYVLAEGLANYIAQVTEDNEKAQEKLTQYEAVLAPAWELLKEAEETLDDRGLPYIFSGTVEKLKAALEDAGE